MSLSLLIALFSTASLGKSEPVFRTKQQLQIIQEGETHYGYELREIVTKRGTQYLLSNMIYGRENRRRFVTPKYYAQVRRELEDLAKNYPIRRPQHRCEPEYQITITRPGGLGQAGQFCLTMLSEKRRAKARNLIRDLESQF